MRSKVAQRILDRTPEDVKIFARNHGDLVVRINQLLHEKGYTQKQLADKLDKSPSEINKWLKGEHNFTLRSLAKLEAELGERLFFVPTAKKFTHETGHTTKLTVTRSTVVAAKQTIDNDKFVSAVVKPNEELAHVS